MSRRSFITIGSVAAASATMALTGCGNSAADTEPAAETTSTIDALVDFETAPAPIAESDIVETKDYDVVIVGAGISGVIAAMSAVENGATVAVLQKAPMILTHGSAFATINVPEVLAKGAVEIDPEALIAQYNVSHCNNVNWWLLRRYFEVATESASWFLAKGIEAGDEPIFPEPNHLALWKGGAIGVVTKIGELAKSKGAEFFFETPGVQLVKEGAAVTGVIGQTDAGYVRFNAAKGVILATGDYGNNEDMVKKYCPGASAFSNFYSPAINDGDGHLMGLWAGGTMQNPPHTKMCHIHHYVGDGGVNAAMRKTPWLNVDDRGERIMNEAVADDYRANQMYTRPERAATQIFDANFMEQLTGMGERPPKEGELEGNIKDGFAFKADTLEEIAAEFGFPEDVFLATVQRYNELVAKGHDDDYYKPVKYLYPIETAPFYAIRRQYVRTVTLGGLNVDADCNCVDADMKPIPGLYAVGNAQGGMFGATDYTWDITGLSCGRAMTFGYMVGRNLAQA